MPGRTGGEHSPVLHSYLLLLLGTNFYGNKVSPMRVEMFSFFHLLWNYCLLSAEPFPSSWSWWVHYPPSPHPLQLLKALKNLTPFLQIPFSSEARTKSNDKSSAYFFPFGRERRRPFGIIFRTAFSRGRLAPVNPRFVLGRVGDKIRVGLRDIFG